MRKELSILAMAGVAAVTFAQSAASFSLGPNSTERTGETCLYSQQLKTSVAARRQYLAAVEEVLGHTDEGAVAAMYGDIRPASYSPDEEEVAAPGRQSILDLWARKTGSAPLAALDHMSADCMGCHDGVSASAIGIDLRNNPIKRGSQVASFKSDHPVGMDYNSYVMGSRGFKPMRHDTKMLFVNGKVGCLTCHDPLNPEKGHLVMSDRESALCRTCHDK